MSRSTAEVKTAIDALDPDAPYALEIRAVLTRAYAEACEDEDYWEQEGKPHLRTFLKTTPLGLAVLDLARAINDNAKELT